MTIIRYKLLTTEKDGVELEYQEEVAMDAANVYFDDVTYDNVQSAVDNVGDLVAPLRVPITLVHNGTLSNGDWIGYSNLLPGDATPVIAPLTGVWSGFTWSNNKTTADFALEFRVGSTGATPFFTWSVDNTQSAFVEFPTAQAVTAGDKVFIKYIDEGTNAADAAIVLKFKA